MNREDIIRMARKAGLFEVSYPHPGNTKEVERFAALVAAAEREACAKADTQGSCIACGNRITHPVPQQIKATAQKGGDKLSPTSKAMRTCKYCNDTYTANAFTTPTGFTCKWCAEEIRARGEQEQPK